MPEHKYKLNDPEARVFERVQPGNTIAMTWARGGGKALALDTPLATPGGWSTMGDVRVGDALFDDLGAPCHVTAVTGAMAGRPCFRVTFSDGTAIIADAEHQWLTWDKAARRSHARADFGRRPTLHPAVRSTIDVRETLTHCGETNHSIPVCAPLRLPARHLVVDPYVLGFWLGDGHTNHAAITVGDDDLGEVAQRFVAAGCRMGTAWPSTTDRGSAVYTIGGSGRGKGRLNRLRIDLETLEVLGNKHIPAAYLRASVEQRRSLLAGLLDSDGCCDERGHVEYTSTLHRLATDVHELALSLGFKATLNEGRATLYGRDCGPKYRVCFAPREHVFGLTRKNARVCSHPIDRAQWQRWKRAWQRYITAVDPVDSVPVRCIEVDSPSHLFLAGRSLVPTHNSWFQRWLAYCAIGHYDGRRKLLQPGAPIGGVRITWMCDTLVHWKDIHARLLDAELNDPKGWKHLGGKINKTTWEVTFPGGSWMNVMPSTTASKGRGNRTDIILPDESDDIEIPVFHSVAQPWFSEPWSLKIRVAGGTPRRGRQGLLYHLHRLGKSGADFRAGKGGDPAHARYYSSIAPWWEFPEHVDRSVVEDARATWHPAAFSREWECNFDSAEGLVYDIFDPTFHVRAPKVPTAFSAIIVGVDWGWTGAGVFLVIGITGHGEDAQAWVIEEHYHTEWTLDQWAALAKDIQGRCPTARWYADPSQPASIEHLRSKAGVNIVGADNRVPQGVACVADKLFIRGERPLTGGWTDKNWARLFVHPECKNTLREINEYRRAPDRDDPESFTDTIIDKNNHAMDGLRYAMMGHFGEPASSRTEWSSSQFG